MLAALAPHIHHAIKSVSFAPDAACLALDVKGGLQSAAFVFAALVYHVNHALCGVSLAKDAACLARKVERWAEFVAPFIFTTPAHNVCHAFCGVGFARDGLAAFWAKVCPFATCALPWHFCYHSTTASFYTTVPWQHKVLQGTILRF